MCTGVSWERGCRSFIEHLAGMELGGRMVYIVTWLQSVGEVVMNASSSDRWWGCICYLSVWVLLPIIAVKSKSEFLARHCRQGFALFVAEVVALMLLTIISNTLGHIPLLGFLISLLLHLALLLAALALSVLGFIKALSGEEWSIPYLDDFADRVPVSAATQE
jgi:uncharacterized membrane protein